MALKVKYDRVQDVLYVKEEGLQILDSEECADDCNLILNKDRAGKIVGIQLLYASDLLNNPTLIEDYPLSLAFKDAIQQALGLSNSNSNSND